MRDVKLIIQWKYTASLCTLVQRLGRGARDHDVEATAVYLVEAKYFDENKEIPTNVGARIAGKKRRCDNNEEGPKSRKCRKVDTGVAKSSKRNGAAVSVSDNRLEPQVQYKDDTEMINLTNIDCEKDSPSPTVLSDHPGQSTLRYLPPIDTINHQEYDAMAMDMYINARTRNICRRRIVDEYFQNDKAGEQSV